MDVNKYVCMYVARKLVTQINGKGRKETESGFGF
jgi:hypothetical protein